MKNMKKLFLSGSNGFIGKNFLAHSRASYCIDAPSRNELELTQTDQVDAYFSEKKYSALIHSASVGVSRKSPVEPLQSLNANLRAFASLFKQVHAYDRFIQLGSGAEYARPLRRNQIAEDALGSQLPEDAYGFAKLICSNCVASKAPSKAVTLNLFGVFGPYEDYQTRFISYAIVNTLRKQAIVINQNVTFDYVYIKDLIEIIHFFIENTPSYSNYNITTGQPVTLFEIAEIVQKILGNVCPIVVKNKTLGSSYTGSNQRLRQFLGDNFKFTPLEDAIRALALWYSKCTQSLVM